MTLGFFPDTDATALADAARKAFAGAQDSLQALDGLEVVTAIDKGISLELASVIVAEGAFAAIDYALPAAFAVATLLDLKGQEPAGAQALRSSLGEVGQAGEVLAAVPPGTKYVAALSDDGSYLLEDFAATDGVVDPLKASP